MGPWRPAQPSTICRAARGGSGSAIPRSTHSNRRSTPPNPDLAATVAIYDQARAFAAQAEAGLYPQINLGASLSSNRQSDHRPCAPARHRPVTTARINWTPKPATKSNLGQD